MNRVKYRTIHANSLHANSIRRKEIAKYNEIYFKSEYWKEDFGNNMSLRGILYNDQLHEERFKILNNVIMSVFCDINSCIDVGCGPGMLLRELINWIPVVHGMDASETAIRSANIIGNDKIICHIGNIANMSFLQNEYDLVCCIDVLEHIPIFDINAAIDELSRITRKHLLLTINTDNIYDYHPTIMEMEEWIRLIDRKRELKYDANSTRIFNESIKGKRGEYEAICYKK